MGSVWIAPAAQAEIPTDAQQKGVRFGDSIQLLGAKIDPAQRTLRLFWRADAPVDQDLMIFVHFLNAQGELLGQADGLPYANQYAVSDWRPGQVIVDERPFPAGVGPDEGLAAVAVGFYDPVTGARLAAIDTTGQRLANDAAIIDCCR